MEISLIWQDTSNNQLTFAGTSIFTRTSLPTLSGSQVASISELSKFGSTSFNNNGLTFLDSESRLTLSLSTYSTFVASGNDYLNSIVALLYFSYSTASLGFLSASSYFYGTTSAYRTSVVFTTTPPNTTTISGSSVQTDLISASYSNFTLGTPNASFSDSFVYFTLSYTRTSRTYSTQTASRTDYLFPFRTSNSWSDSFLTQTISRTHLIAQQTTTLTITYRTFRYAGYYHGVYPIPLAQYIHPLPPTATQFASAFGWSREFAMSKNPTSPNDTSPYFTFGTNNTIQVTSFASTIDFATQTIQTITISSPSSSKIIVPTLTATAGSFLNRVVAGNISRAQKTFISSGGIYKGSTIDINNHTALNQEGVSGNFNRSLASGSFSYESAFTQAFLGTTSSISESLGFTEKLISQNTGAMIYSNFNVFNQGSLYYVPAFTKIKVLNSTWLASTTNTNVAVYQTSYAQGLAGRVTEYLNALSSRTRNGNVIFSSTRTGSPTFTTFTRGLRESFMQRTQLSSDTSISLDTSQFSILGTVSKTGSSFTGTSNVSVTAFLSTTSSTYAFTYAITKLQESNMSSSLTGVLSPSASMQIANAINLGFNNLMNNVSLFSADQYFPDSFGTSSFSVRNIGTKTSSGFYGQNLDFIQTISSGTTAISFSPYKYLYPTSTQEWALARA